MEYLDYFIKSVAPSDTITYTDEFSMTSQNPVMCPVLYQDGTRVSENHGQTTQAVRNYDTSTGSFLVQTDETNMALAATQGYETYSFTAVTDAFSKSMPFTIYFEDCSDAYIYPATDFKITSMLSNGGSETYSDLADIGFVSSDETNCPLASTFTTVSITYCTDTSSPCTGAELLADYWSSTSDVLTAGTRTDLTSGTCDTTSTSCTILAPSTGSEQTIYVTLVYDTDFTVTNTITLEIADCSTNWACASCAISSLAFDSDVLAAN